MLSGIKLVSKEEAERLDHKDKSSKDHKKEKKDKRHHKTKDKKHKDKDKKRENRSESPSYSDHATDTKKHQLPVANYSSKDQPHLHHVDDNADKKTSHQPSEHQREDWMTVPMGKTLLQNNQTPPLDDKEKSGDDGKKVISARELNPYLKNGGDGLPLDTTDPPPTKHAAAPPVVGDGGASWRMKALRRAQSQAVETGKGIADIVAERWGSVNELAAGVRNTAKKIDAMAHAKAAKDRRREYNNNNTNDNRAERAHLRHEDNGVYSHNDGRKPSSFDRHANDSNAPHPPSASFENKTYLSDVRSMKSRMQRPKDDGGVSWKKKEPSSRQDNDKYDKKEYRRTENTKKSSGVYNESSLINTKELLDAAAQGMNVFASDGSFMNRFTEKKEGIDADVEKHRTDDERKKTEQKSIRNSNNDNSNSGQHPERTSHKRKDHPAVNRDIDTATAMRNDGSAVQVDNRSAAAALRARLSGRPTPPQRRHQATNEEETRNMDSTIQQQGRVDIVALPLVDHRGRAVPGAFGRESAAGIEESLMKKESSGNALRAQRGTERTERYHNGERVRYYADDDTLDLPTLVKRAKYESQGGKDGDIDTIIAKNIAKKSNFKETDMDADMEYDYDVGVDLADARQNTSSSKSGHQQRHRQHGRTEASEREKQKQVREYTKFTSALDRCSLCITSQSRQKHLTLALGTCAYLALPPKGRLVPGHCQIVPMEHIASTRSTDETTWTEIRNFKKCVLQMFMSQGIDVVFVETVLKTDDMRAHAVVDCIPVPLDVAAKAPMYFKKAVDDATSDWAQHASKKYIDISSKGLKGAIPPNFPYFCVEFGLGRGFVHVIDDPSSFDPGFARGVLIGLLRLPEEDMHRKAKQESRVLQEEWAREFRLQFDEFDWTKQL